MITAGSTVDCTQCESRTTCGGHPSAGFWGCYDYCREVCEREGCDFTCPRNEPAYSQRMLEVRGYSLKKIDSLLPARLGFPTYVPAIYSGYNRQNAASPACVALPLIKLFKGLGRGQIAPVATSPEELRRIFGLRPDARIIASGVGPDSGIEWLWHHHRTAPFAKWLQAMGVEAATAPNYSYFAFAPRDHFLWNRKRMFLFCQELGRAGFPVIPHLYGDTPFDWNFSAQIFRENPLLDTFAVEFQTGDDAKDKLPQLLAHLELFRAAVGRPLTLVAVAARHVAEELAFLFPSLVIIESSAHFKTVHRQFAEIRPNGQIRYQPIETKGVLDPLFDLNNRVIGEWIDGAVSRGRARRAKIEMAAAQPSSHPAPEIPSNV